MSMEKEQKGLISIVVPVYNVERYLKQCIDSILCQTYQNLEIILVDDGSADGSGKICDAYALKDSRIKVIHKENGGLVSARQTGINIASGEYIGFVDSDDWIEQNMYQVLYDLAILENADIVAEGAVDDFGGKCSIVQNRLPAGKYVTSDERKKLFGKMICCEEFFCLGIQPYLWNKLFRKELVLSHMKKIPSSIRVGEDAAASYPMFIMANRIVVSDTAHYHYCHHENSMMLGELNENQEYDNAVLLNLFLKKTFKELGAYDIVESQLYRYTINNLAVRAYGKLASFDKNSELFLFGNIRENDTVIIYGAGAFGRAVYRYAVSCGKLSVRALVDRDAENYRMLGMDVHSPDSVAIEASDKVIVAVFSKSAYLAIYKTLINKGVKSEQIKWINDVCYPFCIYGAGIVATGIYTALKNKYNCIPLAFLISDKKDNPSEIDGIPVKALSEWNTFDNNIYYLVAVPKIYHNEIARSLCQKQIDNAHVIFIDDCLENKIVGDFYKEASELLTVQQILVAEKPTIQVFQAKCHVDKPLRNAVNCPNYISPIQVGAALTDKTILDLRDNKGDHISQKNANYCELTASYYAWKNSNADYKGLCHYRRIFDINEKQMEELLEQKGQWDVILPYPSIHYPDISTQHSRYLKETDWNAMLQALKETAPEYYNKYKDIFRQQLFYNYNMLIARREVFDDYCSYLFNVLGRTEELTAPKGTERADRFAGYLGENLTTLYFMANKDKLKMIHAGKIGFT